ncbi:alpha-N-acetylglucosaminidase [Shewanella avicenniae]|uniref:Alpha-N-acetylglucosaminidase n=1 Tax=Shewanella avicenniae TaxID=2814294 RepID=A0ABX7QP88_9GAMM|nr:alpha-N-acetylglucosaminidase [Shewanella avicenniae]QSX32668.1 alpha-N-acetylglucosaminidase [Shewanella avicenniae]
MRNFPLKPLALKTLFLSVFLLAACDQSSSVSSVQPQQSSTSQSSQISVIPDDIASVRDVFERISHHPLNNIHFVLVKDQQQDWYQISALNGELTVTANVPTALSYGAYQYLRSIGAMSVSWEGSRVALPEKFDDYHGEKVTSLFLQRAYLNVCAYGYTMPWWNWDRWEKELDWMALHGVNNPVAMEGQEYVWQKLWNEFGVSDEELQHYFSGPAFTPWQRMGNIEGHKGPLPQSWINKKHQLQKQIITRMKSLGMHPVVPAFGGYVPKKFVSMFPDAKISAMPKWTGFEQETYWLDPADPLFAKIAKRFIELYNAEYGEQQYYLSDSFNEMLPPVSKDHRAEDLAAYGKSIYESIHQVVPNATWVMQGWMFGADEEFWDLESIKAFLSNVPSDKVMIHDIGNDRFHVWQRANGFFSTPWIFGFIHNYGGSDPVYGAFDFYSQQVKDLLASSNAGQLTGFGVFPEGLHSDSVAYEYMFDLPWKATTQNTASWLPTYTKARYGFESEEVDRAWSLLDKSVFSTPYWTTRWWEGSAGAYLLFKRPTIELLRFEEHPGDLKALDEAIDLLVSVAEANKSSSLYMYDLVDFTKHSVSQHIDKALQRAMLAYQQRDIAAGDQLVAKITTLTKTLDDLMGLHQESLHSWVNDARSYAESSSEELLYVGNAKQQITVWGGPKLKDYASKAWQGMYAGFYLPRWQIYLAALKQSAVSGVPFDEQAVQQQLITWENEWVSSTEEVKLSIPSDPLATIKALMAQTPLMAGAVK